MDEGGAVEVVSEDIDVTPDPGAFGVHELDRGPLSSHRQGEACRLLDEVLQLFPVRGLLLRYVLS